MHQPKFMLTFTVTGDRPFPLDMLRYCTAWPCRTEDAQTIAETYNETLPQETRNVRLCMFVDSTKADPVQCARWRSFGWHTNVTTYQHERLKHP